MRNNRLHILPCSNVGHVQNSISDNINLADLGNQFVYRKDSRKQTFSHLSQNYSLELLG